LIDPHSIESTSRARSLLSAAGQIADDRSGGTVDATGWQQFSTRATTRCCGGTTGTRRRQTETMRHQRGSLCRLGACAGDPHRRATQTAVSAATQSWRLVRRCVRSWSLGLECCTTLLLADREFATLHPPQMSVLGECQFFQCGTRVLDSRYCQCHECFHYYCLDCASHYELRDEEGEKLADQVVPKGKNFHCYIRCGACDSSNPGLTEHGFFNFLIKRAGFETRQDAIEAYCKMGDSDVATADDDN